MRLTTGPWSRSRDYEQPGRGDTRTAPHLLCGRSPRPAPGRPGPLVGTGQAAGGDTGIPGGPHGPRGTGPSAVGGPIALVDARPRPLYRHHPRRRGPMVTCHAAVTTPNTSTMTPSS